MTNLVLCTKCGNWVHSRCTKTKKITTRLATCFVCLRCRGIMEETVYSIKMLCDKVETANKFCCLQNRLNSSNGYKAPQQPKQRLVRFYN